MDSMSPLTEIQDGDLYFCLEERKVCVRGQEIALTVKEFGALHLLISNRKRVLTFEMISDIVWNEPYNAYSKKTIINHISNLRKKLLRQRHKQKNPRSCKNARGSRGTYRQ